MSGPDYSGEAVTVFVDAGYGPGMWRNACPVDCGWHGSDWTDRKDAEVWRDNEKKQHRCLRAVQEGGCLRIVREGGQSPAGQPSQ